MGVQIDIVLPPIIVGLLIILIFRVNAFIVETSIDNRLNNDVQMFAEVSATILQEEVRSLTTFVDIDEHFGENQIANSIKFFNHKCDLVTISRDGRNLIIERQIQGSDEEEIIVNSLNLSNLEFSREPLNNPPYRFLRVKIETESQPEHHARFRNETQTVRAFEERRFLLRNLFLGIGKPCEIEDEEEEEV
jgi:hypothetical protein